MSLIVKGSGGGKPEEEKTVTAGTSAKTVTPTRGKTIKKVTVNPTPSETKTVTPSASQQVITPSSGKLLSKVTVNGDSDLLSKNIKSGVNIFGVKGALKSEGLYVWKKYDTIPKLTVIGEGTDFMGTLNVLASMTMYNAYYDDNGYYVGITDDITQYSNYGYYFTNEVDKQILSVLSDKIVYWNEGEYSISDVRHDFIGYVVSDDKTKYPNGAVQGGYYYELYGTPLKIVTWAGGTDEEIVAMVNAANKGLINLADYWSVGDERQVTLSAMSATEIGESHVAQTVTFVLMNAGGKTLANPVPSGRTECSFIVGMKNGLRRIGYMNPSNTNSGGWEACVRRTWCNEVFRNAIPESLRDIFKQHLNVTASGPSSSTTTSTDYFALPAEKEVFGSNTRANSTAESRLSQFEYYKTSTNRIKKRGDNGSAADWWVRSPVSDDSDVFCCVFTDGSAGGNYTSEILLLAPFGCI